MSGATKVLAVITTLAAIGAGAYAWQTRIQGAQQTEAAQSAAAHCDTELTACKGERETAGKAVTEASASLSASRAELEELRAEHAEAQKSLAALKSLTEKFQKMIDSGKLQIVLRHGRMVVKLPAGVLFASGSAELSKGGKDALHDVAGILRHVSDRRFMIAGHTDNLPIDPHAVPPSPFKNNLELSTARALSVAQSLIASGMSPARLVAAGYGEHEPVSENKTEAGRQENRRIEIVLMPNVTELPGGSSLAGADAGVGDAGTAKGDAGH